MLDGGQSAGRGATMPLQSLLLIATVPRQLLLVEVDDHLGIAGAGFTGRQQGHVFGVLPVARSHTVGGREHDSGHQSKTQIPHHVVRRVFH